MIDSEDSSASIEFGTNPVLIPSVSSPTEAIGHAIFVRTDVPDYVEEFLPFRTLEEMVRICTTQQSRMTLEKVIVYAKENSESVCLTLGYISSSHGRSMPKKPVPGLDLLPLRRRRV